MTLYLSVTPHIQPTHTGWTADGQKAPPRFAPSGAYGVQPDLSISLDELMERHAEEAEAVAQAARASADVQREMAAKLREAISKGDEQAATQVRNAMWEAIYTVYRRLYDFGNTWNTLAPRITESE